MRKKEKPMVSVQPGQSGQMAGHFSYKKEKIPGTGTIVVRVPGISYVYQTELICDILLRSGPSV